MPQKVLPTEVRCQESASGEGQWGAFHRHQCYKRYTVIRDGTRYCKVHDPENVKARDQARQWKWKEEQKSRRIQVSGHMLLKACKDALAVNDNPAIAMILKEAINKAEGRW